MENIFLKILNMSITAGWLILAVFLVRFLLKKAPKALICVLWLLVGIRLVCPVSFESVVSIVPSTETVPDEIIYSDTPQIQTGVSSVNDVINPIISTTFAPKSEDSANPLQTLVFVASVVWLVGICIMLMFSLVSYLRLKSKVKISVKLQENVWLCDSIDTPFILGVMKPRIYLPSGLGDKEVQYVLAHERAHLKRKDHWWKPLGFGVLALHWFNPLVWAAYVFLCRDIELACDEKVIKGMDINDKKAYSKTLLSCSVSRRMIMVCPLAFGEVGIKERVKSVLNYKKPAFWVLIASVLVCVTVIVTLFANPITGNTKVEESLDKFISDVIIEEHESKYTKMYYACENHKIMDVKKKSGKITVYAWVLYEEYENADTGIKLVSGSHIPTVITVEEVSADEYELVEYWIPGDGSNYAPDIKGKFPRYLWDIALDSQYYIDEQKKACHEMANEYFESVRYTYMDAEILEIQQGGLMVKPLTYDSFFASYEMIWVNTDEVPEGFLSGIKIGDGIRIYFDGKIQETYPARIAKVNSIYVLNTMNSAVAPESINYYAFGEGFSAGSCLVLWKNTQTFDFSYNVLSSVRVSGNYEFSKDNTVLVLKSGELKYTFKVEGQALVFDADKSSYIRTQTMVPDGTVYEVNAVPETENVTTTTPIIDSIIGDIDGDGKDEECVLGFGPTSGLFTVTLSVKENGVLEYYNIYNVYHNLEFTEGEDGRIQIKGTIPGEEEVHIFEIFIEDGNIVLDENGKRMEYWGKQGI